MQARKSGGAIEGSSLKAKPWANQTRAVPSRTMSQTSTSHYVARGFDNQTYVIWHEEDQTNAGYTEKKSEVKNKLQRQIRNYIRVRPVRYKSVRCTPVRHTP